MMRKEDERRRERGVFCSFKKKSNKKLSKNVNVRWKGSNGKKLINLSPQSQKIVKPVLKGKYAKMQKLYGQNILTFFC